MSNVALDALDATEAVPCPLCEADAPEFVRYGRDRLFAQPGRYRLVRCTACGLNYVSPRPTIEGLARHYPDSYFCYTPTEKAFLLLRPFLWALGAGLSSHRLAMLERVTGRLSPDTELVDVGCGINALLRHVHRRRGCLGIGVDFNAEAVAYVRDRLEMPIAHGTLHDAQFEAERFDLVTMTEYLEHEPNPRAVLTEARRITRPGGHLAIEVPHIGSLPAKVFRSRWSQLDLPRHLVFYTPETLKEMLARCGYRLLAVQTFGVAFSVGGSVLQTLGFKHLGRMTFLDAMLTGVAGFPFLPLLPVLREFMFAVARAE